MDFTLRTYNDLLLTLWNQGYCFVTFADYCEHQADLKSVEKLVILRHDVDLKAENSLKTAQIEAKIGIAASYYFRVVPQSNNSEIIKKIVELGHEIGYHYEDMSLCGGDATKAKEHFEKQLAYFRQFYPVKTICMHGAPRSNYDSKDLWQTCDYHDFGIIGEPYFDTDFSDLFYLTDTGRRWDGYKVSLRDKIAHYQDVWCANSYVYHSTNDIVAAVKNGTFPKRLMITTHPQRWTDNYADWLKELCLQGLKNIVKRVLVSLKNKH